MAHRLYYSFTVNSTYNSASIPFQFPLQTDLLRNRYFIRFTNVALQFTYQNVIAPNNTVTLLTAPSLPSGIPITYTLTPGAYTFASFQAWWNSLNWYGAICDLEANVSTNRAAIQLANNSSIQLSSFSELLGSASGTITNTSGITEWFVCANAPQFSPLNALLAICTGVNASTNISNVGSYVSGVVAYLSLSSASPGQYLLYDQPFGQVVEYELANPSFAIIITDQNGNIISLDNTLPTTVSFTIIIEDRDAYQRVIIWNCNKESEALPVKAI